MRYFIVLIILFSLISNCTNQKKNSPTNSSQNEKKYLKRDSIPTLDTIKESNFKKKYHLIKEILLSDQYTYEIQETIKLNSDTIMLEGLIIDIIKNKNDFYVLEVHKETGLCNYKIDIIIDNNTFIKIKSQIKSDDILREGCFILKITSIKSETFYSDYKRYVKIESSIIDYDLQDK